MIDRSEAKHLVEELLRRESDEDIAIVEGATLERPFGWVFFCNTRQYVETGNVSHSLAGNAPYIVNQVTGAVVLTGTAYPIEHYISAYEESLSNVGA